MINKIENWKDYQLLASRTDANLDTELLNQLHPLMGLVTEVGELMDVFKKYVAYGKPIDLVNIKEELGDINWYLGKFYRVLNIDQAEVLAININKLNARYKEKFSQDEALIRNLNEERAILEQNLTSNFENYICNPFF